MPHQCVRCGNFYEDGAQEILKGCSCGSRLFFYIKKNKLKAIKEATSKLSTDDKKQIEKDVFEIIGSEQSKKDPVVLDLESIRILYPGKYEVDLVSLFNKKPLIYRISDGKYMIDLPESFKSIKDSN